jgi:hypothetical protein
MVETFRNLASVGKDDFIPLLLFSALE